MLDVYSLAFLKIQCIVFFLVLTGPKGKCLRSEELPLISKCDLTSNTTLLGKTLAVKA